jgi:hypothetical protein
MKGGGKKDPIAKKNKASSSKRSRKDIDVTNEEGGNAPEST